MENITVEKAAQIIQPQTKDFGVEEVFYENALGRILAENIYADRDLPPFNRPTVDGIAIDFNAYNNDLRSFKTKQHKQQAKRRLAFLKMMNASK